MMHPRFRVATVEGYRIGTRRGDGRGAGRTPGLSATVCDTLYGWREVRTYRSEDAVGRLGRGRRRGREGARRAANDLAAALNAAWRLHQRAERARGYRAVANGG